MSSYNFADINGQVKSVSSLFFYGGMDGQNLSDVEKGKITSPDSLDFTVSLDNSISLPGTQNSYPSTINAQNTLQSFANQKNLNSFSFSNAFGSQSSRDYESEGLIAGYAKKGLDAARAGASILTDSAKNVVSSAQNSLNDSPLSLSRTRLTYCGIAVAIGCVFMLLAFLIFPTIVFAPSKFALLFTIGSICFLVGLGFLKGFSSLLAHMISVPRLPFTAAYFISLILTLYGTLIVKSYFLALLFSLSQIAALISFLISYIPGGTNALKFFASATWSLIASSCKWSAREASLPM